MTSKKKREVPKYVQLGKHVYEQVGYYSMILTGVQATCVVKKSSGVKKTSQREKKNLAQTDPKFKRVVCKNGKGSLTISISSSRSNES
jgi:hypothetical protein